MTTTRKCPYDIYILTALSGPCNLACKYCFCHASRRKAGPANKLAVPALLRTIEETGKTANIAFSGGGEPLLIRNLAEACAALIKKHYVSFNTNLVSPNAEEFFSKLPPARVPFIIATFHERELAKRKLTGAFIRNFRNLRERGFTLYAVAVAHPAFFRDEPGQKQMLAAHGIDLRFLPFIGKAGRKEYPAAYSDAELDYFGIRVDCERMRGQGKLCNAGYNFCFVLDPGGDAIVCPQVNKSIGNIYKKIKFNERLTVCPSPLCLCPVKYDLPQLFEKALRETGR